MVKIKQGDWIELDFIGRIERTDQIFDLTKEDVAKKEGIYQDNQEYNPLKVKIGSNQLLKGLDKSIAGKEVGKSYDIEVKPEEGFGKRNPKMIQLTSLAKLKKKGVNPVPGMPLNIDGAMATVRSVSGGRVILDFNHPLSGKKLKYEINIIRKIDDVKEKVDSVCSLLLNLDKKKYHADIKDNEARIKVKEDIPDNIKELFKKQLIDQVSEIKKVTFVDKKKEKNKENSKKDTTKNQKKTDGKKSK